MEISDHCLSNTVAGFRFSNRLQQLLVGPHPPGRTAPVLPGQLPRPHFRPPAQEREADYGDHASFLDNSLPV